MMEIWNISLFQTVAGLYAIAKELISPIKTADQVYVRPVKRKIMKMKVQLR